LDIIDYLKLFFLPPGHQDTKLHQDMYKEISEEEDRIGKGIVNAAYIVHKELGPGLLEKVYEVCFCHTLKQKGFNVERQLDIPIVFDGIMFEEGLRLDVLVDDLVICELKALENVNPVWEAQLLSHLKLTNKRLGYLINFNVPLIKNGIKRMVI
jgi:GxxExxY protein